MNEGRRDLTVIFTEVNAANPSSVHGAEVLKDAASSAAVHTFNYICTIVYGFKKKDNAHILMLIKQFVKVSTRNS